MPRSFLFVIFLDGVCSAHAGRILFRSRRGLPEGLLPPEVQLRVGVGAGLQRRSQGRRHRRGSQRERYHARDGERSGENDLFFACSKMTKLVNPNLFTHRANIAIKHDRGQI